MNISKVSSAPAPAADVTNNKLLNWAVVQDFTSSNIKCAAVAENGKSVVIGDMGGLCKWSTVDGSSGRLCSREKDSVILSLACIGGDDLWAGLGSGNIVVYSAANGELVIAPFQAHTGKVTVIVSGAEGSPVAAISGGVDFQVKAWSKDGELLGQHGAHHGFVESIRLWEGAAKALLLSGGADGSLFALDAPDGSEAMSEAKGQMIRSSGHGVTSFCPVGGEVWAGIDDVGPPPPSALKCPENKP
mmetsp:Transcript_20800/g.65841  ORF Transcript_20800/g.65841 Transcript_20800/m.65841 type:complete len:245 (+) Transcript_20800:168-902(+)